MAENKSIDASITLNIVLLVVVVTGLFFVIFGAPVQNYMGSLLKAPTPPVLHDAPASGAFVVEYLKESEENEAKLGEKDVNIGQYNLKSTYEPIEVKSMSFLFENNAQELIEKLYLVVDGSNVEDAEFIWLGDSNLNVRFGANSIIVEDDLEVLINADLSEENSGEIAMHFSFADLKGTHTNLEIENQGVVGDNPDPKPQVIKIIKL